MEVLWLEGAVADLEEIFECIALRNPNAAAKVAGTLYDSAARLSAHPRVGRKHNVEVLRIIHGRRDWHTAFDERS